MTTRTHFSLWFICLAFGFALCFILPTSARATTGADGTTCAVVLGSTCIGYDGIAHGTTSSNPDFNADSLRINGCSQSNSNIPNIGTFGATAAQANVVPVYDDAVTKNTGYLVYKACVLDAVASQLKQLSTAKITTDTIKYISGGDNGNPYFVQNIAQDRAMVVDRNTAELYKDYNTDSISSIFRDDVVNASKIQYLAKVNGQAKSYSGNFGDDAKQKDFLNGNFLNGGGLASLWKMATNPSNSPLFAFVNLNATRDASNAQVVADRAQQLQWGQGFVAPESVVTVPTSNPDEDANIYTINKPGYVIAQSLVQVMGSGFRQQEQAQNIDQLIDGTFAGLSETIVSHPDGLVGVSQSTTDTSGGGSSNSGQSYLDQMFQAILALIQKVGTTPDPTPGGSAFTKLSAALVKEQAYLSARQQVQTFFGTQSDKFTSTQNACWITIAHAVSLIATSTPYTVATSTTYATAANADIITPLGLIMSQDIDHSTSTIAVLQTLIASVASSTSTTAEAAALAQLAALTANHTLHTTTEIAAAQSEVTDIQATIGVKVDATIATWKQGTGWCNASSTTVVQSWLNTWKN